MSILAEAIKQLNENDVYKIVDDMLTTGTSPDVIIKECNAGMVAVGDLFASGQYYLTELMFSAEIIKEVMKKLAPIIKEMGSNEQGGGTVVIGTVKGDIHDIGKNIVNSLLRGHGFTVIDLGVDVPSEKFVEAVIKSGAMILGLSALLNSTYPEMKNVVDAITAAGIRERVTIIIGGTICSETVRQYTGADYYANDAVTGIKICRSVYGHTDV